MQELILIISRCVSKRTSVKEEKKFYQFHFRGFYGGERIKKIHLFCNGKDESLTKGEDYLLWVKRKKINQEILEVDLVAYKKIV